MWMLRVAWNSRNTQLRADLSAKANNQFRYNLVNWLQSNLLSNFLEKLFSIIFSDSLRFDSHVNFILKTCSYGSHLLNTSAINGCLESSWILYLMLIFYLDSRMSSLPGVGGGFSSLVLIDGVDPFSTRIYLFIQFVCVLSAISSNCDFALFTNVLKSYRSFHKILPAEKFATMQTLFKSYS